MIEQVVKTRSSTQARSHAQKVLNDELYSNLDEEIQKYENIVNKSKKRTVEQSKTSSTKSNPKVLKRESKRRQKKEIRKESESDYDSQEEDQYGMANNFKENSSEDFMDEDSEYSCPEDPNTKLFTIERVIKKKPKRGKKRSKVAAPPNHLKYEEKDRRKESIAVQSIASTANSTSPIKTLPQNITSFERIGENSTNQNKLNISKEEENVTLKNEDG